MLDIIPGILEQEWSQIERKLQLVSGFTNKVHIDLLDGKFANNTTFLDPTPFASFADMLEIELHMMVVEPIQYIDAWGKIGVKRFLGHIEQMSDQEAFLHAAKAYGEAGLALDGKTPLSHLTVPFQELDVLLVMTIDAGFSGQAFVPEYAQKCKDVRIQAPELVIEVDGGIHQETLSVAKNAGANRFVCTSALFAAPDPKEAYEALIAE